MPLSDEHQRFERLFLPHMQAAYNLARWLTRDDAAAQDIVQESYLRAFKALPRFVDGQPRAFLLTVVRRQAYTWLKRTLPAAQALSLDEPEGMAAAQDALTEADTPEAMRIRCEDGAAIERALERLPTAFREAIILKDVENFSYKDIADITGAPIGTVMSRLSRGRAQLRALMLEGEAP
jgi:RNA polymerase sigma-70 factor (ECF subfamily)